MKNLMSLLMLISLLVSIVHCEEEDVEDSSLPWYQRVIATVKKFFNDMLGLWEEFKEKIYQETNGMVEWSKETWHGFKNEMYDWIDDYDTSESEKIEMRKFIEKLQMPTESYDDSSDDSSDESY